MDKLKAKDVLAAHGLPAGAVDRAARHRGRRRRRARSPTAGLRYPLFVKPANLGLVGRREPGRRRGRAADAVALAATYDEWIVVEEGAHGREIEVAVLGNAEPRASVPGEIIPGNDFYDYEDKYLDGAADLVIPADLAARGRPRRSAAWPSRRSRRLRCDGMARVDFFYEEDGRGLLLNEVNTIPGFTPISMYPKLWAASGLPYDQLIDELVRLGARAPRAPQPLLHQALRRRGRTRAVHPDRRRAPMLALAGLVGRPPTPLDAGPVDDLEAARASTARVDDAPRRAGDRAPAARTRAGRGSRHSHERPATPADWRASIG